MSFSTFQLYLHAFCPRIPNWHLIVTGVASLALTIYTLTRKKSLTYGAVALGLAVLFGLYLLDALALARIGMDGARTTGIDLESEWYRLLNGGEEIRMLMLFNVAAFVPFGFFLVESLASMKRFSTGRRIGLVTLAGLGLSLCIECIQLVMCVGIFEVTDLVLNTLGAFVGGSLALLGKRFLRFARNDRTRLGMTGRARNDK